MPDRVVRTCRLRRRRGAAAARRSSPRGRRLPPHATPSSESSTAASTALCQRCARTRNHEYVAGRVRGDVAAISPTMTRARKPRWPRRRMTTQVRARFGAHTRRSRGTRRCHRERARRPACLTRSAARRSSLRRVAASASKRSASRGASISSSSLRTSGTTISSGCRVCRPRAIATRSAPTSNSVCSVASRMRCQGVSASGHARMPKLVLHDEEAGCGEHQHADRKHAQHDVDAIGRLA